MTPQLNQENSNINTDAKKKGCIDINRAFNWLSSEFSKRIFSASQEFLTTVLDFHLLIASKEPSMLWKGNEYFVTQIDFAENCSFTVKLSNIAAQIILDSAFGQRENTKGDLRLRDLTELEAKILTAYNEFLFKSLQDIFSSKKKIAKRSAQGTFSSNPLHLTFYVKNDELVDSEAGKLIFSFPESILTGVELIENPEKALNVLRFTSGSTTADVFVGKSKISLEDLRNIEVEDIIILEKSNIHSMTLKCGEKIKFKVNPDPRLVINVNTEGGQETVSEVNSPMKDIWDSLQVDVNAEFQKIKITLGELRQITEGLVIDIAPIIDNNIHLHVEGKQVAQGELVIIGDKYGVKVTKVFQETKLEQADAVQLAAKNDEPVMKANVTQTEDDVDDTDFDYSDFEIDDDI